MARTVQAIPAKPVAPRRLRVAAYARVSTGSDRQLSSLSGQVSHYSRLIQATPGWDYAGVYIDEGITGTKTTTRDGLRDLLTQARAGGIDIILCKSISRLARNTVDLLATIRELSALGVSVRFERENIDTATADGELLLTLLASFAQEESRSLSENVKWSIRKRFTQGGTNSFWIYGYTWTADGFTVNEDEASIVRLLFSNYLKGISPEKTATWLNTHGYRSRGGGPFHGSVMRRMLENERYRGCQLLQKTYRPHIATTTRTPNTGQFNQYWVEDALPAIITEEVFDQVQTEITRRRQVGPAATPSKNTGCFTTRIQCAACGCNYQRKTRTYPSGTSYKYWRCWNACKGKGNPCRGHNLRETMLQNLIMSVLGLEQFEEQIVITRVEIIEAFPDRLDIYLTDGTTHTAWLDEKGHAR
ncbi:MAG: recombinase family protein [Actinomycetaceae bacterium]|nr:recombinase family protein [Actinomycetaceae bacterium]